MLVLFNFPSLSKISHNFHPISFCICHTQSGATAGQIFNHSLICKFILLVALSSICKIIFISSVLDSSKKLRWILLSHHSCPLLLFIIQATSRIVVCVHLHGWRYQSLCFAGGGWKIVSTRKLGWKQCGNGQ